MSYYDSISEGYGELHHEEQLRKARVIASLADTKKNDLLLDVGCGDACYFKLFDCVKVGVDTSKELLKKAEGGYFIQARAEELPFADNSFDIVISITAVHNFGDVEKGLREIKRVAKKIVVLSVLKRCENFREIDELINRIFSVWKIIENDMDMIYLLRANLG